jgi:hypothetical protein
MKQFLIVMLLISLAISTVQARGRRPDDEADGFPDYNKLDLHPKTPPPPTPPPEPERPATPPVFTRPSLNPPVKAISDEDVPKPPPPVVHGAAEGGEPPLPEEILNTLNSATTTQSPLVSSPTAPSLMNK